MTTAALDRLAKRVPLNLILFDGECLFCNRQIHFVARHNLAHDDDANRMHFVHLQSSDGRTVANHFPGALRSATDLDTILLIEKRRVVAPTQRKEGSASFRSAVPSSPATLAGDEKFEVKCYTKSAAIFRIGMKLDRKLYSRLATFAYYVLPSWLADIGYDFVAKRRFSLYGRTDDGVCVKPTAEMQARVWKLPP